MYFISEITQKIYKLDFIPEYSGWRLATPQEVADYIANGGIL